MYISLPTQRQTSPHPLPPWGPAPARDYPGVGPEHSYLKAMGRVQYLNVSDTTAMEAFQHLARTEAGPLPTQTPPLFNPHLALGS